MEKILLQKGYHHDEEKHVNKCVAFSNSTCCFWCWQMRFFIRNVVCSGTGVVAGITGLYAVNNLYADQLLEQRNINKELAKNVISNEVHKEIRMLCKQSGVKEHIKIIEGGTLTPTNMFNGNYHILRIPAKCIQALQQGAVTIRYRGQKIVLTDDHVKFMLAHEAGHMKHAHFGNAVDAGFATLHIPLTLLSGKAAHVTTRFKGIAVGIAALYALAHASMHAWVKRKIEKRCDLSIDNDIAHKRIGILSILQSIDESEENEILEAIQDISLSELLVYLNGRVFPTHPSYSKRIQYMQEKISNKKCE